MGQQTEPRYIISNSFFNDPYTQHCVDKVRNDGFAIVGKPNKWVKVYNGQLAAFLEFNIIDVEINTKEYKHIWEDKPNDDGGFTRTQIDVIETGERKAGKICGEDFLDDYLAGYDAGVAWFNEKRYVSTDTMYLRGKEYVGGLNKLYCSADVGLGEIGLAKSNILFPSSITRVYIEQAGFRAGITSRIEELAQVIRFCLTDGITARW